VNGTNLANLGNISGATSNVLTINTMQLTNAGNYTVIVTNFGGSVTSSVATLSVATSPLILTQPADQTVAVGSPATFKVSAIGTVPLSYRWRVNGTNLVNGGSISGATSNVLTVSNVPTNSSGNFYSVMVTNAAGSVTSSNALLTVTNIPPPVITVPPTNQTVSVNVDAELRVTATGTAPLYYQWQKDGTNLVSGHFGGVTNFVLLIFSAQTNDSGNYTVIVTNSGGAVTSSPPAILTVSNFPPVLTLQPASQTVGVGSSVEFHIDGTASPPFVLQWRKDETNLVDGTTASGSLIGGANSNPLTIDNVQTNDAGGYLIIVTNSAGSVTSSVAILTVVTFPTIIVPPTNQTVGLGSVVTFDVTAVGTAPLSYQWQKDGTNLVDGGRIDGATNFTLTIISAQTNDAGGYTVIVTNMVGSVTSSPPAVLTVLLSPRFGNITAAGDTNGGFILSGAGGTNGGTYYVLTSSNLVTARTNWTRIATNFFDETGHFIFTNTAQTNAPQLFYLLQMP
jgi:hypothetical protein